MSNLGGSEFCVPGNAYAWSVGLDEKVLSIPHDSAPWGQTLPFIHLLFTLP